MSDSKLTKEQQEELDKLQKEIVEEALEGVDHASIKQITEITDLPEPTVRRILGQGAKNGEFRRVSAGVYTIKEDESINCRRGRLCRWWHS